MLFILCWDETATFEQNGNTFLDVLNEMEMNFWTCLDMF